MESNHRQKYLKAEFIPILLGAALIPLIQLLYFFKQLSNRAVLKFSRGIDILNLALHPPEEMVLSYLADMGSSLPFWLHPVLPPILSWRCGF